jgi:hypothetical protein
MDEGLDGGSLADVESADALRRVELVPGDREQVDAQVLDVGRDLADGLCGVGVEEDASLARDLADLADGLDRAHLVVRVHHGDEQGLGRDGPADVLGGDAPESVHGDARHPRSKAFEEPARLDDGRVLDRRGDEVVPAVAEREEDAFEGVVVRLAPAAGEDDLRGIAVEEARHLAAGALDGLLGRLA